MPGRAVIPAVFDVAGDAILICPAYLKSPQRSVDQSDQATVLEAAMQLLIELFGTGFGECVLPLGVMSESESVLMCGQACQFVVFTCCSELGEVDPSLMASLAVGAEWVPLDGADVVFAAELKVWASPILRRARATAEAIDLSGLWSRDAERSVGLEKALEARGLTRERAEAEARRPYVQRWHAVADEPTTWEVTTYGAESYQPSVPPARSQQSKADRVLLYRLGDWVEPFVGQSVLHGAAAHEAHSASRIGTLVRRTAWIALPACRTGALVSPTGARAERAHTWAHTTWTSRTDAAGEIVCRYLLDDELVVRRTLLLCSPIEGHRVLATSEETFVRLGEELA